MNTTPDPDVVYLADHSVLLAIPAFVPAFLIVGFIIFLAVRDRKAEATENADQAKRCDADEKGEED